MEVQLSQVSERRTQNTLPRKSAKLLNSLVRSRRAKSVPPGPGRAGKEARFWKRRGNIFPGRGGLSVSCAFG